MLDSESRRTRRMIAASIGIVLLFFVSMFQSCSELKHAMWGNETTGEIASVEPSVHKRNALYISFFTEDETGERVRIKRSVPESLGPFTLGEQIEVVYLSGRIEEARLAAEASWFWPIVFFVMLGAIIVWVIVVWLQTARM